MESAHCEGTQIVAQNLLMEACSDRRIITCLFRRFVQCASAKQPADLCPLCCRQIDWSAHILHGKNISLSWTAQKLRHSRKWDCPLHLSRSWACRSCMHVRVYTNTKSCRLAAPSRHGPDCMSRSSLYHDSPEKARIFSNPAHCLLTQSPLCLWLVPVTQRKCCFGHLQQTASVR